MAHSSNVITHGMSGMVGDTIVFRQVGGKTVVAAAPKPTTKDPSVLQQQQRLKFQEAIIYGKTAMADPSKKAAYEASAKESESAFNVAVADLLNAPDIESIDISAYKGKTVDKISITAIDDFAVTDVFVSIYNADGSLVEEGPAVLGDDGIRWQYTAIVNNDSLTDDKIIIKAGDLAGNLSQKEQPLV